MKGSGKSQSIKHVKGQAPGEDVTSLKSTKIAECLGTEKEG